jgi:hypothetical protein
VIIRKNCGYHAERAVIGSSRSKQDMNRTKSGSVTRKFYSMTGTAAAAVTVTTAAVAAVATAALPTVFTGRFRSDCTPGSFGDQDQNGALSLSNRDSRWEYSHVPGRRLP